MLPWRSFVRLLSLLVVIVLGVFTAALFALDVAIPVEWGVLVLGSVALWGLIFVRLTPMSLLPRLMIVLYALPFSALVGYWIDRDYVWWPGVPGAVELIQDRIVVSRMVMMGIVGLCGLLTGMWIVAPAQSNAREARPRPTLLPSRRTLGLSWTVFAVALGSAAILSWLSAPAKTIFAAEYASEGVGGIAAKTLGFQAAFLVSYILLVLLYIDAEREAATRVRRFKLLGVIVATGYIVFGLNILRGDREVTGLIAGLMALYLTGPRGGARGLRMVSVPWSRIRKLLLPSAIVIVVLFMLGSFRYLLASESRSRIDWSGAITFNFRSNTWTGVLLTNLGLAGQHRYGELTYNYGKTYWDYFLSLPPGMFTRALGVDRPMDQPKNFPNFWFPGVSGGGVHAVVVPFKSFGIVGLFVILAVYGAWVSRLERNNASMRFWPRLLWASVLTSSFHWVWYGDMNLIRGVMAAVLFGLLYQVTVRIQSWSVMKHRTVVPAV